MQKLEAILRVNGQDITKHVFDWSASRRDTPLASSSDVATEDDSHATLAQYYVYMTMAVVTKTMTHRVVLMHAQPVLCTSCRTLLQDPEERSTVPCADARVMMENIMYGTDQQQGAAIENSGKEQTPDACAACVHELGKLQRRAFVYGAIRRCPAAEHGIHMYLSVLQRIVTFCPQALSINCDGENCFERLESIWEHRLLYQTVFHLKMYRGIC